jgi:hypothetical protein
MGRVLTGDEIRTIVGAMAENRICRKFGPVKKRELRI